MTKSGKKNKRGARGSVEEDVTNDAKRPNMADSSNATVSPSSPSHDSSEPETSLTELKGMLSNIQETLSTMKQENLSLREELMQLKTTLKDEMLKWKKLDSTLAQTSKENAELKKELQFTKQKLQAVTEEKDRIDFDLEELQQYTRKNSLEIHGVPQEAYTATEDVVLKIGEVLDVPISPGDIEISHQLKSQNKPIIVKFLSHKVKSRLYKKRTALKDITVSDLFPTSNYATSLGRGNRIFLNENLTTYRRSVVKKANGMRKNGLLVSVWTTDGKIFVKSSPSGSSVRIHCLEHLDNL